MDPLAGKLDAKLRQWKPATARKVRAYVEEIIESADSGALDLMRSRTVEHEVLHSLDEPAAR
jgi:hypothetical protein